MQQIGLKACRFSIVSSRVYPEGTGRLNAKGLDFYDRLVDELLKHGILPFCTLYHWICTRRSKFAVVGRTEILPKSSPHMRDIQHENCRIAFGRLRP